MIYLTVIIFISVLIFFIFEFKTNHTKQITMYEFKNYSQKEIEEVTILMFTQKGCNKIQNKICSDFMTYKYGEVMQIKALWRENKHEDIINYVLEVNKFYIDIYESTPKEFYLFLVWIKEQLIHLNKMENSISSDPDPYLQQAGVSKLNKYNEYNIIKSLSLQYNKDWDDVKQEPYHQIFMKLMMNKDENEIKEDYQNIMKQVNKNKK